MTILHQVAHNRTRLAMNATADIAILTITYQAGMGIPKTLRPTNVKSGTRSERMEEPKQCETLLLVPNRVVVRKLIMEGPASRIPTTVG